MSQDPISASAKEISRRLGVPDREKEIEDILRKNHHTSGLDRMTTVLQMPWPWITGVIGVWSEGYLPQSTLDKILVAVTLGAAVEAVGSYLQSRGIRRPATVMPILSVAEIRQLDRLETVGAAHRLIVPSIVNISALTHYQPPVDIEWQRALRHTLNNPRFARLIV